MPATTEVETVDILFIADDPDLAEMYRLKLELDGYWVHVVEPESAVAEARKHRPELVFLDLPPGRLDRLSLLRDVRSAMRRPELPAIVLSSTFRQELQQQSPLLSAFDYIVRVADLRSTSSAWPS